MMQSLRAHNETSTKARWEEPMGHGPVPRLNVVMEHGEAGVADCAHLARFKGKRLTEPNEVWVTTRSADD